MKCRVKEIDSFTSLKCEYCEEVKHIRCALKTKHLRLEKHHEIGEQSPRGAMEESFVFVDICK